MAMWQAWAYIGYGVDPGGIDELNKEHTITISTLVQYDTTSSNIGKEKSQARSLPTFQPIFVL
jgi:hypothetical protein